MRCNKGFSLIELMVAIAVLVVIFLFVFYFISTISIRRTFSTEKPYMLNDYNYSDIYCTIEDSQLGDISIVQVLDLSSYISTSTPITSINIFDKNRMIITTNSASTTEKDIFLFTFLTVSNTLQLELLESLDIGPGIHDALLHDNFIYVLNTSINSHVRTLKINTDNASMSILGNLKIAELSASGALPKKMYLYDKNIFVGTEKNNAGGELFVLPLNGEHIPQAPIISAEVGGQVSDIYENQGQIFVANASDTELFIYDKDLNIQDSYDAPLSLGNGKSVYYSMPYIYLGRTVASFELFLLKIQSGVLNYLDKRKAYGSIDFIQSVGKNIAIISSSEHNEFQVYDKSLNLLKTADLPGRVLAYSCLENSFLLSILIHNQSHIIWLK